MTPVERRTAGGAGPPHRARTHAEFRRSMITALASADRPALTGLATRDPGDFAIALLDAWATVADVLSFYSARIAAEGYLLTATERLSVRELARLVGYELRPGNAASAALAFTVETATGAPAEVSIPAGLRVSGAPAGGLPPPVYETVEEITGRGEWNALRPRTLRPPLLADGDTSALVNGVTSAVAAGDTVLLVRGADFARTLRTVVAVTVDTVTRTTRLDFTPDAAPPPDPPTADLPAARPVRGAIPLDRAWIVENILGRRWDQPDLEAQLRAGGVAPDDLVRAVRATPAVPPPATAVVDGLPRSEGLFVFRVRAAVFGHNAPDTGQGAAPGELEADVERTPDGLVALFLDAEYPALTRGSWIAVLAPDAPARTVQIQDNVPVSRSRFGLSARVSRVTVRAGNPFPPAFRTRTATVLGAAAPLTPAVVPLLAPVRGDTIELDDIRLGLRPGQRVAVSGRRTDLDGTVENELTTLAGIELVAGRTVVRLAAPLAHAYLRDTVTISANVAAATHGETVARVLGSGDATLAFQRFPLPDPPLTTLTSPSSGNPRRALEVRVDGVAWRPVDALADAGPDDQVYVVRHGDGGTAEVAFGDGVTGARLPTGAENVRSVHRRGNGLAGLVDAGQLTLPVTRPAGLTGVTNPRAAAGAADPDTIDDARRTAPLIARTLDRVVSLSDYEDFARAFPGIGKALATRTWTGRARAVFLTVAGAGGRTVDEAGVEVTNLRAALARVGDPAEPVVIRAHSPAFFRIAATVRIDPGRDEVAVLAAAEARLRAEFGAERRGFGRPVARSEVITVIQETPGVVAVDLDRFERTDDEAPGTARARLVASPPRRVGGVHVGAELLLLDPRPPELGVAR
jgi:predicted phage baseplate assembly protein